MVSNGYEMCDDFAQTTTATLGDVMGFDYCWLDVRTRVGGYDRTSSIWYRVRTNETPRVSTSLTCSDIVFLNDGYVDDGEIVNGGFRAERVYPVRFKLNIPEATNAVVTLSVNGNVQPRLYADAACETPLADTTFEMAAAEGENVATWYLIARKIGSGAVRATATLPSGEALTNAVNFRVIEPIRKLVTTSRDPEGFPVNPSRLVYEHGAWLEVGVNGQFTADEVAWSVVSGPGRIASVSNWQAKVEATADAGEVVVEASFGGDNTVQPRFVLPVIEEKRISIQGFIVCNAEMQMATTLSKIGEQLATANQIFRQAGIRFYYSDPIRLLRLPQCYSLRKYDALMDRSGMVIGKCYSVDVNALVSSVEANESLRIFWVNDFVDVKRSAAFCILSQRCCIANRLLSGRAFAHELGHLLGLEDIYWQNKNDMRVRMPGCEAPLERSFFEDGFHDWMQETGRGFYEMSDAIKDTIESMVMHGIDRGQGFDLPFGRALGYPPSPKTVYDIRYRSVGAENLRER